MTEVECVPVDKRGLPPAAAEAASSEATGDVSKEVGAAPLSRKQPIPCESVRDLAQAITDGHAFTDADAVRVARAYLDDCGETA